MATTSGDLSASGIEIACYSASDLALCSTEEARACLPCESAVKMMALPIALVRSDKGVKLHCAASSDTGEFRRTIQFLCGYDVVISCVRADKLEDAILRAYLGSDHHVRSTIERLSKKLNTTTVHASAELPKASGDAATFLSTLLEFAVARGASDLHLSPSPQGAFIRLRVDGELLSQREHPYPILLHEQVISRLKVLAGLDIACKRLPQDGAFTFRIGSVTKCIRLSTLPALDGESAVLRLLYARKLPQLSMLGIDPLTMNALRQAIAKTQGMVLLTGPTGSGKTTTMYSLALEAQNQGRSVVTVEDPVEAPIPGMVQVQVREQQGLDYPRAIRSVLRHDPDVIVIGEMRDRVSARIALTAASTGHLTISSLHMGSALAAIERLRSFDIPARESSEGLSLVLNQRLLGKLCGRCKEADPAATNRFKEVIYRPKGCSSCNGSGYDGRVLVSEMLDLQSYLAKDVYSRAQSAHEALSSLPSGALLPWTYSLEYHLKRGAISLAQCDAFIDDEIYE